MSPSTAVLLSGSPSPSSKSRVLLEHAGRALGAAGYTPKLIDLSGLPSDALLGRSRDDRVDGGIESMREAALIVAGSPVYRATFSGLLKVFLDLFEPGALAGAVAIPVLTGGTPRHQLALEHGFRPLLASLGAVVTGGVYGIDRDFDAATPSDELRQRVNGAVAEGIALAWGLAERLREPAGLAAGGR